MAKHETRGKDGKFVKAPYHSKLHEDYCHAKGYIILQRQLQKEVEVVEIEVGEWRTWTLPHIATFIAENVDRRYGVIRKKMEGYEGEPFCDSCGREFGADC